MSNLHDLTLTELSAGLTAKRFSSREVVDALLARIAKADSKLHAFTEVYANEARALADAADTARTSGFPLGPLHGLPIAYKDLCDIAGRVGTGGSKMFEGRIANVTSNTVERLTAAGMVPLGKLHMVEFAFGGWGYQSVDGRTMEPVGPRDPSRPRRLIERYRCRRRCSSDAGGHWQRHRRLGAHSLRLQRSRRPQGHLRSYRPLGHDAAELVIRLDWSDGPLGRGLRPSPERAGRTRRA
jgi:hypothetical protein